jgi:amino acid transporter
MAQPRLRRDVGFWGLTFVSLGSIIGSGWLLGGLTAATAAGPASLVSWVIAGFFLTLLALVHAELGATYPVTGGTARFPHIAFGPLAGFTSGWMAWIGTVTLAPIEVEAALTYTNNKWPGLVHTDSTLTGRGLLIASVLMLMFTVINIVGVKWLANTNTVTVIWKTLIPVLTVVVLILIAFHGHNFTGGTGGFAPYGAKGIFTALPLGVVFAMQGFEQALQVGGEARNPQRNLPRAILTAMAIGTVVYLLLEVAFIGSLDPSKILHGWAHPLGTSKLKYGPFAALATGAGAGWLATLLYIDAFVSPSGTGLLYVGTSSRLAYALGRNRYIPPQVSKVGKRGVPVVPILLAFVVGELCFLPFPSWASFVGIITSASALMYAFAPISLAALRRTDPDRVRPFRLRGAAVISPLSFVAANWIVYWAGWSTDWRLFAAVGVGFVLFAVTQAATKAESRTDVDWRTGLWLFPWLGGMAAISYFGQYDGTKAIPFWWDLAVVAAFSLVVYYVAVALASSPQRVAAAIDEAEDEANYEHKELEDGSYPEDRAATAAGSLSARRSGP